MRLFVESGPQAGLSVELDRNQPVAIGSAPDAALRLSEPGVLAQHAIVKALRDDGYGIKALAAGVRVNGAEVEAAPLAEGDAIEIGTTRIVYAKEAQKAKRGPQIKGFQIQRELGKGGMGMVFLAEQTSLKRQVALKVLDDKRTKDPAFVSKFVAEARAAAKLSHPNVVHVFDVDQDGGTYYYAMELMHHGSLEAWLKKNGKMPVERALQVIADAASGLAYAESLRIVHRDIKPDNLMLDQHGTVKIADLGLAFTEESGEEQAAGTPHFMAPEQVLRKPIDHRTDLYALGCTFYRLVTGRTPFRGQTVKDILRAQVKDEAEPANKVESSVPPEVAAIVQKLMQKEPADRYQSATELLEAVQTLLQPPAKKGLWIGLAAAGALLASGAIYWAVTKPKDVIKETEYIDNPEAARLAGVNKQLEAEAKEDKATIAVLRARLDGKQGEALAQALDEVAGQHAGTRAATEAKELAGRARADVAAAQAKQAAADKVAENALAALRGEVEALVASKELPRALSAVDERMAPPEADANAFARGKQQLRDVVLAAAATHRQALRDEIARCKQTGDAPALRLAAQALDRLAADANWKDELVPDRSALAAAAKAASADADALESNAVESRWRAFAERLHQKGGVAEAIARCDFAAAEAALAELASGSADQPVVQRAQHLRASLQNAAAFATALKERLPSGELHLQLGTEPEQVVTGWRADSAQFVLTDASKKPAKETLVAYAELPLEALERLAIQVQEPSGTGGSRACFLAFAALDHHLRAARAYLGSVSAKDDATGTGAQGYPLGLTTLDVLLTQLPAEVPACLGARAEVQAARSLAAGLRALSERRNLAAASHLERLLQEHARSLCATGLP